MKTPDFFVCLSLSAAAVAGCYTGGSVTPPGGTTANGGTTSTSVSDTDPAAAVGISAFDGLPCDVAKVLAEQCSSCHGPKLAGGAPNHMMTYDDLVAPSASDTARTVAEVSVDRMQDASNPMPPTGAVPNAAAVISKWIAAGMQRGTCADDTIQTAPADTTYDTPTVCTSNAKWTKGDRGSTAMHPGVACIQCHDSQRGPSYVAAGTVYPTAHEPDDCNGSNDTTTKVVITDKNGKTYSATINSVGNFYISGRTAIATPYTAKIVSGTKTRAMVGAQTDGDCNDCHTEQGTQKAPGRLMAP